MPEINAITPKINAGIARGMITVKPYRIKKIANRRNPILFVNFICTPFMLSFGLFGI
jgi:hypothetical protein